MQTAVFYNKCNAKQEYILSCGLEFDKSYYSNYMERILQRYWSQGANITVHYVNKEDSLEYPSAMSICLKATFQLSNNSL
jgi:hypothetical protein